MDYNRPRLPSPSPSRTPSGNFPQRPFYRNNFIRPRSSPRDHHVTSTPRFPRSYRPASVSYSSYYSTRLPERYMFRSNFRGNSWNTQCSTSAGSSTGSFRSPGSPYYSAGSSTGSFRSPGSPYPSPGGRMRGHYSNVSPSSSAGSSSSVDIRSYIHPSMLENPWEQLERNMDLNQGTTSPENLT